MSANAPMTYTARDCPRLYSQTDLLEPMYSWRYRKPLLVLPASTFIMVLGPAYGLVVCSIWLASVMWVSRAQYTLLLFYAQADDAVLLSLDPDGFRQLCTADKLKVKRLVLLQGMTNDPRCRDLREDWERHVLEERQVACRQEMCLRKLRLKYYG